MKIENNIYFNKTPNVILKKDNKTAQSFYNTQPKELSQRQNVFAYRDFGINVNFTGRTPEDFNRYNIERNRMPVTMKEFLMVDYEKRCKIPPQQVMEKVYEHLNDKDVKSVVDVKRKYPNETLFANLHEPEIQPRKSILSEIEVVKELGDAPLFKDGTDDFGLYLLRKIYLEGKSENEINKDFYEKDLNKEYKGMITKEITNGDFRAYGIKFPVVPFWNSFINTRDEYKKFRIDMSQFDDKKSSTSHSSSGSHSSNSVKEKEVDKTPKPRKFTIKKYQKAQIEKDIKDSDMSEKDIEKKIRKRFSKDDPEASFIVKYLSPIMIVAAEKVHLSEELKIFNEMEKSNGKQGDETFMLKRFWKNNPTLKTDYAQSITDTIDLFEEIYGAGGMVPINNEFQPVNPKMENKKIIDYVDPNFIDFIQSIKNLEIERIKRYEKHDALQAEWEEHFLNRYGELKPEVETVETKEVQPKNTNIDDALKKATQSNPNLNIYNFTTPDGAKISLALDLREVLTDRVELDYKNMPRSFIRKYVNFILNHPEVSEDVLLSFACNICNVDDWGSVLNNDNNLSEEENRQRNAETIQELKNQLMPEDEVKEVLRKADSEFEEKNKRFVNLVRHALMEYSTRIEAPNDDYIQQVVQEKFKSMDENGEFSNMSDIEKMGAIADIYKQINEGINAMKCHNMVYLTTRSLDRALSYLSIQSDTKNINADIENIMKKYQKPLTNSERQKIIREFVETMINMDPNETETFKNDLSGFYKASMEALKDKKNSDFKKELVNMIHHTVVTPENTILRYLIDKNADKNLKESIVEIEVSRFVQEHIDLFEMLASIDKELMDRYIRPTNISIYNKLQNYRRMTTMDTLKSYLGN